VAWLLTDTIRAILRMASPRELQIATGKGVGSRSMGELQQRPTRHP
jgi:hypothetical protein